MSEEEKKQILKVLSGAIQRETGAFNFYSRKSEDPAMPGGVRGLLARLAEEERRHRRLLLNEYMSVKKGWQESEDREKGKTLSFSIPRELTLTPLDVSSDLDIAAEIVRGQRADGQVADAVMDRDHLPKLRRGR